MKVELKVAIGAALAGLLVGGFVTHRSVRALDASNHLVTRSHEILDQVRKVRIALTDAEARQWGHLLTGRDEYRVPDNAAAPELPTELDRLEALTADDPEQLNRVRRVRVAARERFDAIRTIVAQRRNATPDARVIDSDRDVALMNELRHLMIDLEANETQRLQSRSMSASADATTGYALAAGAGAALLGLIGALVWRQSRDRDRP